MTIPIIEAEEVMTGRVKGSEKYIVAIEKQLDWIKKSIESGKDGMIIMKTLDFARELGPDFSNKTPIVIYRHTKDILFDKNIIVEQGTHKDGDKLLIMRFATKMDKLREPEIEFEEDEGDVSHD